MKPFTLREVELTLAAVIAPLEEKLEAVMDPAEDSDAAVNGPVENEAEVMAPTV
jgi:hypothetical protein